MPISLTALPHWLHRRLNIDRRRSESRLAPVTLAQSRIFILPTRGGLIFATILVAMLVAATNFDSSELFLLTFLMVGIFMVSMLHSYRNLARLSFHPGHEKQVFCGEPARHALHIDNPSRTYRPAITFQLADQTLQTHDIAAEGGTDIALFENTTQRGRQAMPELCIATRYPLGLFRAWSRIRLEGYCLVYPQPSKGGPRPHTAPSSETQDQGAPIQAGQDDFIGYRAYQITDSPQHIDWKAVARGRGWITKQFASQGQETLWLNWDQLAPLSDEARLSQLCRWVLMAEAGSKPYGMRLPGQRIEAARGDAHKHRCLKALALYGND